MKNERDFFDFINWKGDRFTLQCYVLVGLSELEIARERYKDYAKENDEFSFVLMEEEWPYGVVLRERDVSERKMVLYNIVDLALSSFDVLGVIALSFMFEPEFMDYNIFDCMNGHRGIYAFSFQKGQITLSTDINVIHGDEWKKLIEAAKSQLQDIMSS